MSLQLRPREKSVWEVSPAMRENCLNKGQSEDDCHNYIMVLQSYGNRLYACGTYAFSPFCSWRQMENLNVTKFDKGVAKCPYNPHANITTVMTDSGTLFVGSPTDFSGTDPAILRVDVTEDRPSIMRTNQYNSKWLNDPQFVGSFEHGNFVYFVFRETAVEFINCGKVSSAFLLIRERDTVIKCIINIYCRSFIPALLGYANRIRVALTYSGTIGRRS